MKYFISADEIRPPLLFEGGENSDVWPLRRSKKAVLSANSGPDALTADAGGDPSAGNGEHSSLIQIKNPPISRLFVLETNTTSGANVAVSGVAEAG